MKEIAIYGKGGIGKTHLGSAGGLFLIEQILNSFVY